MATKRRINLEAVKADIAKGMNYTQIAASQGASYPGIVNFCRTNNLIVVKQKGVLKVEEVKENIEKGLSQASIADKNGVSPATVSQFLKANQLTNLYKSAKDQRPKVTRTRKAKAITVSSEDDSTESTSKTDDNLTDATASEETVTVE